MKENISLSLCVRNSDDVEDTIFSFSLFFSPPLIIFPVCKQKKPNEKLPLVVNKKK